MQSEDSYLLELAGKIQKITTTIVEYLKMNGIAEPNFHVSSSPVPTTLEYSGLRASLNDAAKDLMRLVNGPETDGRNFICTIHELGAWQIALEFGLFEAISIDETQDLTSISEKVGIDADRVGRILRLFATDRIFEEVGLDKFCHTARSSVYHRSPQLRDACHYQLDEFFKAASESAQSIKDSPHESSHSKCAFNTRHGVDLFSFYHHNPRLAGRFASAMAGIGRLEHQFEHLRDAFPWSDLQTGKVVDIGGGNGSFGIALARAFPSLEVVIQDDNIDMLAQVTHESISDLDGRVTLMQHNFFEQQPLRNVAALLLRQCTLNWNDPECIRIIRSLIPALESSKPGTPFIINDVILPEPHTASLFQEHRLRQTDIMMMGMLGTRQRTKKQFQSLIEASDRRLVIKRVIESTDVGLIEIHLDSSKT